MRDALSLRRPLFACFALASLACLTSCACAGGAARPASDIDTLTIAHAPPSPSSSSGPSTNVAPLPRARFDFDTVAAELTKECAPKAAPGPSNVEMKLYAGLVAECKGKLAGAEEDRLFDGTSASREPSQREALSALVAQYRAWAVPVCWLSEESQWIDFDNGTRDDGTARSYAAVACMDATSTERLFLARTLREGDASGIARHIEARGARGAKNASVLAEMEDKSRLLLSQPIPLKSPGDPFFPIILDDAARRELATKTRAVLSGATRLAESTCRAWPALARALGGPVGCETAAPRYFLAQGTFGHEESR
jgi:hypothetical protein